MRAWHATRQPSSDIWAPRAFVPMTDRCFHYQWAAHWWWGGGEGVAGVTLPVLYRVVWARWNFESTEAAGLRSGLPFSHLSLLLRRFAFDSIACDVKVAYTGVYTLWREITSRWIQSSRGRSGAAVISRARYAVICFYAQQKCGLLKDQFIQISQCRQVTAWGWTARCGRPPLLPSCRKLEFCKRTLSSAL